MIYLHNKINATAMVLIFMVEFPFSTIFDDANDPMEIPTSFFALWHRPKVFQEVQAEEKLVAEATPRGTPERKTVGKILSVNDGFMWFIWFIYVYIFFFLYAYICLYMFIYVI